MNPNLLPLIKRIRRFPLSDQLDLIGEISRNLSHSFTDKRDMHEEPVSECRA